jgi:hypothetical protein
MFVVVPGALALAAAIAARSEPAPPSLSVLTTTDWTDAGAAPRPGGWAVAVAGPAEATRITEVTRIIEAAGAPTAIRVAAAIRDRVLSTQYLHTSGSLAKASARRNASFVSGLLPQTGSTAAISGKYATSRTSFDPQTPRTPRNMRRLTERQTQGHHQHRVRPVEKHEMSR